MKGARAAALLPSSLLVRLVLAPFFCASGCGYLPGFRAPAGVESIAVPVFNNETFPLRREVEYDLTDAFRKEIQTRTSLLLVDEREADMVVYGTVRAFEEKVAAEGRRDEKTESTIYIVVELLVEDYRNKRRWRERVQVREPLSSERGETLEESQARALANLAERLLTAVEAWEDP